MALTVNGSTHTATVTIDHVTLGSTPPGHSFPALEHVTVWVGQPKGTGENPPAGNFYYDGVALQL